MEVPVPSKIQIPFTLYDLFGYFLPGITFAALSLLALDFPRLTHAIFLAQQQPNNSEFKITILPEFIQILHYSPWFVSGLCLLISYVIGHIIAAGSSFSLERMLVRNCLGYPTDNMLGLSTKPTVLPSWVFKTFRSGYSQDFLSKLQKEFTTRFNLNFTNAHDIFWTTFEYVAHNCPATFARALHFLNLYGFSRNLSMTFLCCGMSLFAFECAYNLSIHWWVIAGYIIVASFFFWNYLKLFRRLDDEVYRGFYAYIVTSQAQVREDE